MKNHVVSLELSKKMDELGIKLETEFYWGGIGNMGIWSRENKEGLPKQETRFTWYPAPLASELGEYYRKYKSKNMFARASSERVRQLFLRVMSSWENENEIEDRAKMLIYLKKNKLL